MSCSGKKSETAGKTQPLPAHSVRVSARARRVALRVLPGKGLEVVLPRNADPACVPLLLTRHRAWIEKHLRCMADRPPGHEAGRAVPERMLLKGGTEEVVIRILLPNGVPFAQTPAGEEKSLTDAGRFPFPPNPTRRDLTLPGDSPAVLLRGLRQWVREEARLYLGSMLETLASEHGFSCSGLSIRFQRSRWGSCSAKGSISLNACLLFLPERLTRHIILHELCHTRQLNHSQAFWKQLFSVSPDALALDKAMRRAWRYVPAWIFA